MISRMVRTIGRGIFEKVLTIPLIARILISYVCFSERSVQVVLSLVSSVANSNEKAAPYFVVIGACDGRRFDTITPWLHRIPRARAILVEPIPWLARELRINYSDERRFAIETVAIADHTGRRPIKAVSERAIKSKLVPDFARGLSSITDRNLISGKDFFGRANVVPEIMDNVEILNVECVTLKDLLCKHRVQAIDVLVIDSEGYDWNIIKQFDFSRYRPIIIKMEVGCLPSEELGNSVELLLRNGYSVQISAFDLIAVDKELRGVLKRRT
jgi:FkbM family methyltransferase